MQVHSPISKWTGAFTEPGVEDTFLALTHTDRQRRAWVGAAIWGSGWLLWTFVNAETVDGSRLVAVATVRIIAFAPLMVIAWTSRATGAAFQRRVAAAVLWHGLCLMAVAELTHRTDVPIIWHRWGNAVGIALWATLSFRQLACILILLMTNAYVLIVTHTPMSATAAVSWSFVAISAVLAPLLFHSTYSRVLRQRQQSVWQLQAALQSSENLMAAVAHELRIPLAKARLRVAMAHLNHADEPAFAAIDGDLDHLNHLISGLVDLGRIDSHGDHVTVDLTALVHREVNTVAALRPGCAIQCQDRQPIQAPADPHLMATALRALLSNAADVAANVQVHIAMRDGMAWIHVDDDGPGVPPADRKRIFDPLVRGSEARAHGDAHLGLGLSTAQRIANAHGGHIDVLDSPLGGARFRLAVSAPRP